MTPPPPLRWWEHAWRLGLAALVSLVAFLVTVGPLAEADYEPSGAEAFWILLADPVLGLAAFVIVLVRRRWPFVVAALTAAFSAVSLLALGPATLALASLATRRRPRELAPVIALTIAATVSMETLYPSIERESWWVGVLYGVLVGAVVIAVVVAIGYAVGADREGRHTLRERAETNEREQQARVAAARAEERTRIAREMHDVLAHKISLISLHAGVLAYQDDLSDDERRQTATLIQETSHQALEELREVLGVLRSDEIGANAKPQPSLLDLPALIAEEEAAGTLVTLDIPSDFWLRAGTLGPNTTRHAHRIVQEALTNARKHAGGQPVDIRVGGDERAGLDIYVHNRVGDKASTVPGSGLGLPGLLERAQLAGGTLEATHSPTDFTIHAHLPWDARIGS